MSEIIPQEDDITKKQLWERIDLLRSVFESHKGEIIYKIDGLREAVNMDLGNANSEHTLMVHKRMSEIEGWLNTFKVESQRNYTEAVKELKTALNSHLSDVEAKLKEMHDSIENVVKTESEILFSSNENRITTVEEKFDTLSKDLNEALSRYQIETRTKIGTLLNRIERVISKLRDGFSDL